MAHRVGIFELKYEHRGSWKAERRENGRLIDVIPVTWSSGWRKKGHDNFVVVWFQNQQERERHLLEAKPFIIALAREKDPRAMPPVFSSFQGVFLVEPVQVASDGDGRGVEYSVDCRVLQRLDA